MTNISRKLPSYLSKIRSKFGNTKNPIIGILDSPTSNSTLAGGMRVAGWAISQAPIARVEVLFGDKLLGTARYGLERPDVAASQSSPLPERLRDRQQILQKLMLQRFPPHPSPLPLGEREQFLPFLPLGARLKARFNNILPFLAPKEKDGKTAFNVACGYSGIFTFDPADFEIASQILTVRVIDQQGHQRQWTRSVQLAPNNPQAQTELDELSAGSERAEIERAEWQGDQLLIEGWAIWPEYSYPRQAFIYLNDQLIGQAPLNQPRPTVKKRFPTNPTAHRCAFRYQRIEDRGWGIVSGVKNEPVSDFPLPELEGLGIYDNNLLASPVSPENNTGEGGVFPSPSGRGVRGEGLFMPLHPYFHYFYKLLPLKALGEGLGVRVIPSPSTAEPSPSTIYHLPSTVLKVEFVDGRGHKIERVKSISTVNVSSSGEANSFLPTNTAIEQPESKQDYVNLTVSIVIPVYNKSEYTENCLQQLLATLPPAFTGEIIIVDDASTDNTPALLAKWAEQDPRIKVFRNPENQGFIHTCNRGAKEATGEILIFLNNDTLPQPGWLPPLLRILQDKPEAGAVGGKLIYPDGRLQEAGNVIFSDGSGYNCGKFEEAVDAPLYNYVREVDYCSGALLATRRPLFLASGGFDTRYTPAYYEDTDYCFTLREKGYKVYYQPESVIVHFEGISSGTDLTRGVKSYQVINQQKFVEKWGDVLRFRPSPQPSPQKGEGANNKSFLKVLVVAPRMPELDRESGLQRIYHFLQFLKEEGYSVSFVAHNATGGESYARMLRQLGVVTYAGNGTPLAYDDYLPDITHLVKRENFDLALLAFWDLAELYLPAIWAASPDTRIVVDSIDLHFLREARKSFTEYRDMSLNLDDANFQRLDNGFGTEIVRELNIYGAADTVLTVSQKEADLLNNLTGNSGLAYAVPDSEDLTFSTVPLEERRGMLFIGNFRHPPNLDAANYLCNQILPQLDPTLLAEHPVYIVGNGLDTASLNIPAEIAQHVHLVGWVPSLLPYLEKARLSLIPLRYGAGTKRKLIQTLMIGTPAVSTSIGIEGLDLKEGENVLVADNPTDFAAAITRIIQNKTLWQKLAKNGREHITPLHSREAVHNLFTSAIKKLIPD